MSNDAHWVVAQIVETRKRHPSVTKAVATRMEELLRGQLSERQASPGELMRVAKALIADMVAAPPKAEPKR